jgi:hypothetical protein
MIFVTYGFSKILDTFNVCEYKAVSFVRGILSQKGCVICGNAVHFHCV